MPQDPTIPSGGRGDRRRGLIYPSPFFDVAQSYMPPTIKELLKWCAYFFYTDPLIGSVVYKIAEYPITDFVYSSEDEHVRRKWKDVLEDTLNIKPFLIEIGLDFFTFGNAFISINLPFRRLIKCSECKHQEDIREVKYRFKSWEFHYKCPGCKEEVVGKTKDVPIKSASDINFIRWDPKNIEIEYNPLTGKSRYRYRLPNKIRKAIMHGKPEILNDIPWIFIEAAKSNKDIILSTKNLFHFKRPTLAEQDQGWGKPLIIHSLKRLFYLYVLRRAQEAIALERILPKEFVFPQPNSSMDPYSHISLANWSSRIQNEIAKFRCVSPDSFVETKDGLKRAKDIQEGDWLKNRNGDFERVTHKNERPLDPGEMAYRLHVRGQSAVKTIFSEEHPIWAARRIRGIHKSRPGTPEFVHVSELKPGDFVGYPIKRSVNDTKEIDLSEHVDRAFTEKWIYADHTETNTPLAFEYLENGGSGPDARKEFGINPTKVAQRAIRNGNGLRRIPRHIPLDEEFAYALGLYAAEGNSTPSQVLYAFNTKEVKSLDRVKRFFSKRFNANGFSATKTENCIQYFFSSSVAAQVFSSILPGISRTKRIPDAIKSAPDNIVIEFLKGIFDGDGCYYKNENKTTIKLSNLQLCEDIRQLILSFQIMPGITSEEPGVKEICGRKTKCQTSFRVQVSGNNNKRFLSLLNKEKYTGPTWSRIGIFKDGYAWFRIKAIEEAKANTVIGFSMEGDETFCTWGIATHNTDPNYTSVVPVPLGFERMGGDGRALMLGPELEIANKEIAGGMGVPLEFIMGGLSWSGSSVSLRTLENHFLMYRRLLMRFLNFVKGHLTVHLGLPDVDLKFTEFKMADDIQRKQLVVQLNAAQKISNKTLLTELGFDFEKEQKTIREEVSKMMELQEIQMKAQAKAQGEAQITSVKYQMQAQEAQMKAQQQMQEEQGEQDPQQQGYPQDPQQQGQPQEQQQGQPQQPSPEQAGAEREMAEQASAQANRQQPQREKGQTGGGGRMIEFDVDSIAKRWATRLMKMDAGQRNAVLADMQSRMPNMARVVMTLIGMTPAGGTAGQANMKPLPEQRPPRRKDGPV